jgi:hypothetical protein
VEIKRVGRAAGGAQRPGRARAGLHLGRPVDQSVAGADEQWGQPASVLTEFDEHGITNLVAANRDRAAGYARILELLEPDAARPFPGWHPRHGELGSPRLFVFSTCSELIEQLQSAPLETQGEQAGRAVAADAESSRLHARAMPRAG